MEDVGFAAAPAVVFEVEVERVLGTAAAAAAAAAAADSVLAVPAIA